MRSRKEQNPPSSWLEGVGPVHSKEDQARQSTSATDSLYHFGQVPQPLRVQFLEKIIKSHFQTLEIAAVKTCNYGKSKQHQQPGAHPLPPSFPYSPPATLPGLAASLQPALQTGLQTDPCSAAQPASQRTPANSLLPARGLPLQPLSQACRQEARPAVLTLWRKYASRPPVSHTRAQRGLREPAPGER